jgi:molybdate/tungstate transport system substrate-binding protein
MVIILLAACWLYFGRGKRSLVIYHAGSLSVPFRALEEEFESMHPDVDVRREIAGSAKCVRKITDLGKTPDIISVSDYSLLLELIPKHTKWYLQFACNKMGIAYTGNSKYCNELNNRTWYKILERKDVKFGFSSPNDDPCGYRTMIVIQLAELYYNDSEIFERLVSQNTAISSKVDEDKRYHIEVPENLAPTEKVRIRSMEVQLIALLQADALDYIFIYSSVAKQHELRFLELPPEIDLSSTEHAEFYEKVIVHRFPDKTSVGKPIVYGISMLSAAPQRELALQFLTLLLTNYLEGKMEKFGQPEIVPAGTNDFASLPHELRKFAVPH